MTPVSFADLKTGVTVELTGEPLGSEGSSRITLHPGVNLVGIPLKDSRLSRVSDLFALEGVADNVTVIIVWSEGEFKAVTQPGDSGDIPITGGQSFILTVREMGSVDISGDRWTGSARIATPPTAN